MRRVDPFLKAMTEQYDHPLDRLAGAVIAMAVYDATNQVSRKTKMTGKTIRNNSAHVTRYENKRQARENRATAARLWLINHGEVWMCALGLEPSPIMEIILTTESQSTPFKNRGNAQRKTICGGENGYSLSVD